MASEAFTFLGIADAAGVDEVRLAYRTRARELHPDAGGDPVQFAQLHDHYLSAMREVTSRPCPDCGGTGKIVVVKGFHSISSPCMRCR